MKKEFRDVATLENGEKVRRITTADERVYVFPSENKKTKLPEYVFKPSVTYITAFYPKGKFFEEWLKSKNGDETDLIKRLAGEKGHKVHQAITVLMGGEEVKMEDKLINPTTGEEEEITVEEYDAILSYQRFWEGLKEKEFKGSEFLVDSNKYNYAGTVDLMLKIDGQLWLIDVKTGQNIYEDYKLQVSAYKQAMKEKVPTHLKGEKLDNVKLAILQVGYRRNKNGYKFTEIEDKFGIFLNIKAIFENEVSQLPFKQVEYPLSVKLEI